MATIPKYTNLILDQKNLQAGEHVFHRNGNLAVNVQVKKPKNKSKTLSSIYKADVVATVKNNHRTITTRRWVELAE